MMHHGGFWQNEQRPLPKEMLHHTYTVDGSSIGHVPYISGLVSGGDLVGGRMRFTGDTILGETALSSYHSTTQNNHMLLVQ